MEFTHRVAQGMTGWSGVCVCMCARALLCFINEANVLSTKLKELAGCREKNPIEELKEKNLKNDRPGSA